MSHEIQIVAEGVEQSRGVTALPSPRIPSAIRVATTDDFASIDAIQKSYHKQLGFFPRAQMEGYINNGWVIVAEDQQKRIVGYCASRDRYQKRDELGAIFQLCVAAGNQRKFVGMAMLAHVFEHAPYGCKLFCCWCAQDIEANRFWESLGFIPLAFRAGSRGKGRIHIFWQKRIRSGDCETPYWFPSQTSSGAIREDRLVLPIPPGVKWDQVMPIILPGQEKTKLQITDHKRLQATIADRKSKIANPPEPIARIKHGGLRFGISKAMRAKKEKPPREKKTKQKNDPKLVAAARELRDRWMEQVNAGEYQIESNGKYEVARLPMPSIHRPITLLPAA